MTAAAIPDQPDDLEAALAALHHAIGLLVPHLEDGEIRAEVNRAVHEHRYH